MQTPANSAKQVIRFGVNPWGTEKKMHAVFRPLMDYLQERLGVKIEIVIPDNYDALVKRTANGEIDLASFNSVALLRATHAGMPIRYLVTALKLNKGETESRDSYTGYIIVKKNSRYQTIDDLKGKLFAFVDTDSASGYKMPSAFLATTGRGTPKEFFKKYFFVGDHDEVISAVYHGCVDGGATWDNSYNMNMRKTIYKNAFRIIETIPDIPNDAWVTGPGIDEELSNRIKGILLAINMETKTADGRVVLDQALDFPGTGWVEKGPEFYERQAKLLLYGQK